MSDVTAQLEAVCTTTAKLNLQVLFGMVFPGSHFTKIEFPSHVIESHTPAVTITNHTDNSMDGL